MLQYNEVRPGVAVIVEGEPYVCTWNNVMQKQQRRPVNQTKLRHIIRGNVIEYSFQQSDKLQEAEIEAKPAIFVFHDERKAEWVFHDIKDKSKRFSLKDDVVGEAGRFLKANTQVETKAFQGDIIAAALPIKVDLKVTEAPPSIRGNTAQGGSKVVTLETGATIDAPLFIEEGDVIRINTTTGEYVERA
jgi:elongation factor P